VFEKDLRIRGKHAAYAKQLAYHAENTRFPVFKRIIDVYMIGAIMGFLNGRRATEDTSVKDEVSILASTVVAERDRLRFIYRLIMLLDSSTDLKIEERINRAFRSDSDEQAVTENMKLFHAYVCGGIEFLYEKFQDCTTNDDYIEKMYEIVERFKHDLENNTYDDAIRQIIDSRL